MKSRLLWVLGMTGLLALASAQDGSQNIRYTHSAARARLILDDLSKTAKMELLAAPSVAEDILYLNLRDVSVDEARKRIASTLHAEWHKEGERLILDRPASAASKDERDEAVASADRLKKSIDQMLERSNKLPPWSEEVARRLVKTYFDAQAEYFSAPGADPKRPTAMLESIATELPGGRTLIRILSLMGPQQLQRMFGPTRAVFSTRPTRMQLPMPNGADVLIGQLIADMRTIDRVTKDAEGSRDRSQVFATGAVSPIELEEGDIGQPGVTILRTSGSYGGNVYFQLTVADANGETITTAITSVPVGLGTASSGFTAGPEEKAIELSDNAAQYGRLLRDSSGGLSTSTMGVAPGQPELLVVTKPDGTAPQPGPELFEQVINPDRYEPMRLAPTEGLDAVSSQLSKNVVAYLPDTALLPIQTALLSGKLKPSDFLNQLQSGCDMSVRADGDWLELSPVSPASSRRGRVNRGALAKALKALVKQGYLNLEDLSAFASQQESAPGFTRWDRACFMVINASSADQYFGYQNPWWLLRLYGTLTASQKQTLLSGAQLPLANLSSSQLDLLGTEAFRSGYGVNVDRPAKPKTGAHVYYPGLLDEVTYVLPNGVTREGFIQVTTTNEQAVQTLSSQTGAVSFLPFGGIAWSRMNQDRPDLTSAYGPGARADRYRMATKANYEFRFQFAPIVSMTAKLSDVLPDNNAKFVAYDGLPADFRNMVDSAAARLKGLAADVTARRSGGSKPPP